MTTAVSVRRTTTSSRPASARRSASSSPRRRRRACWCPRSCTATSRPTATATTSSCGPTSPAPPRRHASTTRASSVEPFLCIADFFRPIDSGEADYACFHIVTMGSAVSEETARLFAANEYQRYLLLHGLGVEMAEALAEYWHKRIREEWGFVDEDGPTLGGLFRQQYRGGRYSWGYPACPDLEDNATVAELLGAERLGIAVARTPAGSTTPSRRRRRSSATTRKRSTSSPGDPVDLRSELHRSRCIRLRRCEVSDADLADPPVGAPVPPAGRRHRRACRPSRRLPCCSCRASTPTSSTTAWPPGTPATSSPPADGCCSSRSSRSPPRSPPPTSAPAWRWLPGATCAARVFHHVGAFSAREVGHFGAPSLITRNTNDVQQVQMLVLMTFTMLVMAPIMAVGGIVMAMREGFALSWLLLVSVPAAGVRRRRHRQPDDPRLPPRAGAHRRHQPGGA